MRRSLSGRTGFSVPLKTSSQNSNDSKLVERDVTSEHDLHANSGLKSDSSLSQKGSLPPNTPSNTIEENGTNDPPASSTSPRYQRESALDSNSVQLITPDKLQSPSPNLFSDSEALSQSPIILPRSLEEQVIGIIGNDEWPTCSDIVGNETGIAVDDEEMKRLQQRERELDSEISELESSGLTVQLLDVYMDKLHRYNDLKDLAQMVFGQLSLRRGVSAAEVHRLYNAPPGE